MFLINSTKSPGFIPNLLYLFRNQPWFLYLCHSDDITGTLGTDPGLWILDSGPVSAASSGPPQTQKRDTLLWYSSQKLIECLGDKDQRGFHTQFSFQHLISKRKHFAHKAARS